MPKTIGEKIEELRNAEGWSQETLGSKIGRTQQAVAQYESGARFPRAVLKKLSVALRKPISYFIDDFTEEPGTAFTPTSVVFRASSLKNLKDLPERRTDLVEVPVASGAVAAGLGRIIEDDKIEDWAWIPSSQLHGRSRANLACVRVDGDSMEPIIRGGSMICVDRSEKVDPKVGHPRDAIYAVLHGGKVSVKYIQFTDHIMALLSANYTCPPMLVDLRDNPSPVIGRVVWVWQAV